ncbi:hypothetical protein KC901_02685 [Patescibacteria group bacterium]|nr:hypothetical protein [Patescibacteria group bacterium]
MIEKIIDKTFHMKKTIEQRNLEIDYEDKLTMSQYLKKNLRDLGLSSPASAQLMFSHQIITLSDLVSNKIENLVSIQPDQLHEIVEFVSIHGLKFGMDISLYTDEAVQAAYQRAYN